MRFERTFRFDCGREEAARRAEEFLRYVGYVPAPNLGPSVWQREMVGSALWAVNPRQKRSRLTLVLGEQEARIQQRVIHQTDTWTQLDKAFMEGELDDLEAWICHQRAPAYDRARQSHEAANWHIVASCLVLIPALPVMAAGWWMAGMWVGFLAGFVAYIGFYLLLPVIPKRPQLAPALPGSFPLRAAPSKLPP